MSKRRGATVDQVRAWLARGDGQGVGKQYKPFLNVRDVPSTGRSTMVKGLKTGGRTHHYVSDGEYGLHVLAEWDPNVTDIREQYALLPWEETQEIADNLRIRHPTYPGTSTPIVVTSDVVLTTGDTSADKLSAISYKPSERFKPNNAASVRVLEKLLIEKTYWDRRSVQWCNATEEDLPRTLIHNLDILRASVVADELDYLDVHLNEFCIRIGDAWDEYRPFCELLDECAASLHVTRKEAHALFGRTVWARLLTMDLNSEPLDQRLPIKMPSIARPNRGSHRA